MKYLLLILVCFFSITNTHAQSAQSNVTIQVCELQATTLTDTVFLRPCGEWISLNGCPANNFVMWNVSSFQGRAMYEAAQIALLENREIIIRTDGQTCNPFDFITLVRLIASPQ